MHEGVDPQALVLARVESHDGFTSYFTSYKLQAMSYKQQATFALADVLYIVQWSTPSVFGTTHRGKYAYLISTSNILKSSQQK